MLSALTSVFRLGQYSWQQRLELPLVPSAILYISSDAALPELPERSKGRSHRKAKVVRSSKAVCCSNERSSALLASVLHSAKLAIEKRCTACAKSFSL